jgi:hypothetical protein
VAPTPLPRPEGLSPEEAAAWDQLDALILESWRLADADNGKLWFTVVGRQGDVVALLPPLDSDAHRWLARPAGDAGKRVASQSGMGMFIRNRAANTVKVMITSGIGNVDARKKLAAHLERLDYFRGCKVTV